MNSPDPRSGLVFDTHELGRRAGAMKHITTVVGAPPDLGIAVIRVPAGSPMELDLRLESVIEGVLVTGVAGVRVLGECVRCLADVHDQMDVELQELFVYPGHQTVDDEASRMHGDLLDLEPVLRDAVVLDLPFQPLCRVDCRGLCPECGANLNDQPGHTHNTTIDPRWSALAVLQTPTGIGDN